MHVSDEDLQFLRICAILHDVGKPACWAQKQVASEHIRRTYETLKQTIGENYGFSAMRHHSDSGYSLEVQPKTELEKIIMISNKLASDAHDQEVNSQGLSVFSLPVHLTHVLSSGTVLYTFDAQSLLSSVQELKLKLASCRAQIERNSESGYLAIYEVLEASAFSKIPADPRTPFNDISLWEHLKLTAAFAMDTRAMIWSNTNFVWLDVMLTVFLVL
jgi:CRISPR/Cas system-associated protein Cas10 (large subunit of type III CRISPR-Cas system)